MFKLTESDVEILNAAQVNGVIGNQYEVRRIDEHIWASRQVNVMPDGLSDSAKRAWAIARFFTDYRMSVPVENVLNPEKLLAVWDRSMEQRCVWYGSQGVVNLDRSQIKAMIRFLNGEPYQKVDGAPYYSEGYDLEPSGGFVHPLNPRFMTEVKYAQIAA